MDDPYYYLCAGLLWVAAFAISLWGGHFIVKSFRARLGERHMRLRFVNLDPYTRPLPPAWMGCTERFIFTLWIGVDGFSAAAATGVGAWLALKLATNWNRRHAAGVGRKEMERIIRGTQLALLSGVFSLGWAMVIGGLLRLSLCALKQ